MIHHPTASKLDSSYKILPYGFPSFVVLGTYGFVKVSKKKIYLYGSELFKKLK